MMPTRASFVNAVFVLHLTPGGFMSRLAPFVLTMGFAVAVTGPSWAQEGKPKADPAAKAEKDSDKVIPVWPGDAPGSEKWTRKEIVTGAGDRRTVRNVVQPTLTPFLPKKETANGTAVVIAPGGAFRFLSWDNEGTKVAQWLSERGVTAFVLKYRLVDTGSTDAEYQ
jgi:acetyl esterase/lipase